MRLRACVVPTLFLLVLLLLGVQCAAAWWDTGWNFRRRIDVDCSYSLTNFPVAVDLDESNFNFSHAWPDGRDIRFVDWDDMTLLPYWIDWWDYEGKSARIWVKVPYIPSEIYMYYGNFSSSVQSLSNANDVFLWFDDFSGSHSWSGSGTYDTSGEGYVKATSSDELATSELVSEVIGSGDFLMTLKIKMSGSGNPDHTSYSHELRMLDDSGEYIIDDESITEWEERTYTLSGDNIRIKLYADADGYTGQFLCEGDENCCEQNCPSDCSCSFSHFEVRPWGAVAICDITCTATAVVHADDVCIYDYAPEIPTVTVSDVSESLPYPVVEIKPEGCYVVRNWEVDSESGVYVNDSKVGMEFVVEYSIPNAWDLEDGFVIKVRHLSSGQIFNITSLSNRAGNITYNVSTLLFHESVYDDKYGTYIVEMIRAGNDQVAFDFFHFTYDTVSGNTSGVIYFDKESYVNGEVMRIITNLTAANFTKYRYYGRILNSRGAEMEEWRITAEDSVHEVQTDDGWDTGTYFALLEIEEKTTGFKWEADCDTATLADEVKLGGVAYDAKSGSPLADVYVEVEQNAQTRSTLTDSGGSYEFSDLLVDADISVRASKSGYVHENFTFTPIKAGYYTVNLYLLPDEAHINVTPPAIVGVVRDDVLRQAIANVEVSVWNDAGWNATATTTATGYFEFDVSEGMLTSAVSNETFNASSYDEWVQLNHTNVVEGSEVVRDENETVYVKGSDYEMDYVNGRIKLLSTGNMTTNTTYYISYEKYETTSFHLQGKTAEASSAVYNVSVEPSEVEYVWVEMPVFYNLTVVARDADTHVLIPSFSARLDEGDWVDAESGEVVFRVPYGIYKLEVVAEGYYAALEYVGVKSDMRRVVYLVPLERAEEGGVSITYTPHQVEFVCVDLFNNPLPGIYVEATPLATSVGRWEWLLSLFGLRNESLSYYRNQTINGTTDDRGAVVFLMMENVEYEVRFVNESLGIDKTMRIYPKGDYYYVVVLTPSTPSVISSEDYISFNLSYELVDGGENIRLSLEYHDELNQTQNLTFFVYNSSNALLCQQNFTAPNASHVVANCTVPYVPGEEYLWGFSAFHSKFGEVGRSRILTIKWFLDLGIPREFCTWIAVAILLFLTGMFSFVTAKFGYVVVPLFGLFFAYIGWLPNIGVVVVALCLGVLAYMSKREKEVGL